MIIGPYCLISSLGMNDASAQFKLVVISPNWSCWKIKEDSESTAQHSFGIFFKNDFIKKEFIHHTYKYSINLL